jgi:anthranilate/para-aminobenzoate synthase component I
VTGAPKVRAVQIIDELEPVPRGPYCGAIGWITHEAACLNVAIRTMVLRASDGATEGRSDGGGEGSRYDVSFHVGGGIVADSEPAAEYAETLDKARAMLRALGSGVR